MSQWLSRFWQEARWPRNVPPLWGLIEALKQWLNGWDVCDHTDPTWHPLMSTWQVWTSWQEWVEWASRHDQDNKKQHFPSRNCYLRQRKAAVICLNRVRADQGWSERMGQGEWMEGALVVTLTQRAATKTRFFPASRQSKGWKINRLKGKWNYFSFNPHMNSFHPQALFLELATKGVERRGVFNQVTTIEGDRLFFSHGKRERVREGDLF